MRDDLNANNWYNHHSQPIENNHFFDPWQCIIELEANLILKSSPQDSWILKCYCQNWNHTQKKEKKKHQHFCSQPSSSSIIELHTYLCSECLVTGWTSEATDEQSLAKSPSSALCILHGLVQCSYRCLRVWVFLPSSSWVGFSWVSSSAQISASRRIVIGFLWECKVRNVSIIGSWWNSIAVVGVSWVSSFRLLVSVLEYHQEWSKKEEEESRQTDRQTDRGELREVDRESVFFCVWHG